MPIVPTKTQDLLTFCELHAETWAAAPTTIGITAAQATAFTNAYNAAQGKFNDAQSAADYKKAATLLSQNAVAALRVKAAETIALIKAFAENQADPDTVYTTAQIPAPAAPSPAPAPGTPYKFVVTLDDSGAVKMTFKCDNPEGTQGTIYEFRRKVGTGAFAFIGASGTKSFTDATIPAGSSALTYQVQAVRSTIRGTAVSFNVNFGVGGDGMAFAKVESTQPSMGGMKMAA